MTRHSIIRAIKELIGLRKIEARVDDIIHEHERMSGDVRDMRQRLESLKHLVAAMRRGENRQDEF